MREFNGCKGYKLISKEELTDVSTMAYTLEHTKTGAKVVLLSNEDDNKGFIIGFKTPQKDSTGVPHILEHSVLCGSEKYPVKDAMTEVSKGSLNTFINAFTYPDRTLYPVASCNDKDFSNLLSVYLDAVFFPRVHTEKKIFMQEGWHYEMEKADSDLTINGVVYNEMKGVYSSPESALSSYILFSLFPDTQYGVESGGDPDVIPTLSYEDFCAFHKKLYHPSNSRIYLYGDMDFEEKLKFIDEEYLSKFEKIVPDSEVKLQKPFKKAIREVKNYSILDSDDEKDSTFLSYNVVCSDYTDIKTTEAMNAINYALCSVPGAKLKQRLIDAGIGKDVYSEMTNDTCQKIFSIIAEGANPKDEAAFIEIIESTIKEIIKEGFDKKTLEAAITSSEFSYREADYGYFPKAIAYGSLTFERWLYTDDEIFSNLKQNEIFKELRNGIGEGLFERVLKERVLENPHKSIVILKPVKGLSRIKDEELSKKLSKYKESLSKDEINRIVSETKALKKYQEEPDSPKALSTIPSLEIKDIKKKCKRCDYIVEDINGIPKIFTEVKSNGITYFTLGFKAETVPKRLIPALSVLKLMLGYVNTKSFNYGDFINECNIKSGGINPLLSVYKKKENTDDYSFSFEVKAKSLNQFLPDTFSLINEMLFTSDLSDKKRVKEILEQTKVRISGFMMSSGHSVAVSRASASGSDSMALLYSLTGMGHFRFVEELLKDFDTKFEELVKDMKECLDILLRKGNLEVFVGTDKKGKKIFDTEVSKFIENLSDKKPLTKVTHIKALKETEAFSSSSQVQYVAACGNFCKKAKLPYDGGLLVLRAILDSDYLWTAVRLQGGAYGCFSSFGQSGDSFFVSYRDPNLKKTIKVYKNASKYIKKFPDDRETLNKYIISAIGELDTPLTPSMKAYRAVGFYKSEMTNEDKQKERDEILRMTPEKLRGLSVYIDALMKQKQFSAVSGEEILKKEGDMFDNVSPLITQNH